MHVFTSITVNYIPKARVLAGSVKKFHPDAEFLLVLSDRVPDWFDIENEPFDSVLTADQLGIPDFRPWAFKHAVVELCTAVKGFSVQHLFRDRKAEHVFYLDPDIVLFSPLDSLLKRFEDEATSILLTPHQTSPEKDRRAIMDNEICSLKHGVFNLGFLGVKNSPEGLSFTDWWAERLRDFCFDDIAGGLFTDQRWVDLAPCFFDEVCVVRESNYNVATWNLTHRKATGSLEEGVLINGKPLCFYHFSGFDCGAQEAMLNIYGKHSPVLRDLREWYMDECRQMGQDEIGNQASAFDFFDNGEKITRTHRILYRSREDLQQTFRDPFSTSDVNKSYYHWFAANVRGAEAEDMDTDISTIESLRANYLAARNELDAIKGSRFWRIATFFGNARRLFA